MEKKLINDITNWIKNYVTSAYAEGVVIGMSGGKDSLIVAKLCAIALGEDTVFGVIMPNGEMSDKSDAVRTCELLKIPYTIININDAYNKIIENTKTALNGKPLTDITTINTAPRIRTTTLYAIA